MFRTEHFVQFVFANENDRYYPNCMMETDLHTYLWYQLQKDRFEHVYFVDCDSSGCTVETYDAQSAEQYLQRDSNMLSWLLGSKKTQAKDCRTRFQENKADSIRKWITECTKKDKKQALVMPLDSFCRLFDGEAQEKWLKQLAAHAGLHDSNTVILLLAPLNNEAAINRMTGKDSIFCKSFDGHMLCDSLELLRSGEPEHLFSSLEHNLGSGFTRLDSVTKEMIYNILLHRSIVHPNDAGTPEELEQQARFLTDWCSCSELQSRNDLGWEPGSTLRYTALKEQLEQPGFYEQMISAADEYWPQAVIADIVPLREDALSQAIRKIELPSGFLMWTTEETAAREQFREFQRNISGFWTHPRNGKVADEIQTLLYWFKRASNNEDWNTLNEVLTLMFFCGKHICLGQHRQERFLEICRQYKTCVIEQSEEYFLRKQQEQSLREELAGLWGEAKEHCQTQLDICTVQYTTAHKISTETRIALEALIRDFDSRVDQQAFIDTLQRVNQDVEKTLEQKLVLLDQQHQQLESRNLPNSNTLPEPVNEDILLYNTDEPPIPAVDEENIIPVLPKSGRELAYERAYLMDYDFEE